MADSKSGDEQISLKEPVDRMKEGQNNMYYMGEPIDEHTVNQPVTKSATKEGLEIDDDDKKESAGRGW